MNKLFFCFALLSLIGCRLEDKSDEPQRSLHIVATTGIIGDVLENIVGDSAEVTSIMGPGTDPHIYKPTPGDIDVLDDADVIVANGLHLEGKMQEMLEKYGREKPVIFVADGIDEKKLIKSAAFEDSFDPHIWFDTEMWMSGMSYVASELGKIDTGSADYFQAELEDYQAEVSELDDWIEGALDSINEEQRILITSHDAFSYFGRKFDIEVKGIQGISTMSEVGLKDISDMVDFVVDRQISAIFVESATSDKTAQSIVDGSGAKGHQVEILGPLFADALGEPHDEEGTYLGMIRVNVETIVKGLE